MELNDKQLEAAEKYSKEIPVEPVLLCDSCQSVNLLTKLNELGHCEECGNKRVRTCLVLNKENKDKVLNWIETKQLDPLWLELFEGKTESHNTINTDGVI